MPEAGCKWCISYYQNEETFENIKTRFAHRTILPRESLKSTVFFSSYSFNEKFILKIKFDGYLIIVIKMRRHEE